MNNTKDCYEEAIAECLSEEERYVVCIHEAAHAVVSTLASNPVIKIEVVPVGATGFTSISPKGREYNDISGVCYSSNGKLYSKYLVWNQCTEEYEADIEWIKNDIYSKMSSETNETLRKIRGCICTLIAGIIAEQIYSGVAEGDVVVLAKNTCEGDDCMRAHIYSRFLPLKSEYYYMIKETERVLRNPVVWSTVLNLASELSDKCVLANEIPLLHHIKPIKGFPQSPRARNKLSLDAISLNFQ